MDDKPVSIVSCNFHVSERRYFALCCWPTRGTVTLPSQAGPGESGSVTSQATSLRRLKVRLGLNKRVKHMSILNMYCYINVDINLHINPSPLSTVLVSLGILYPL